MEQSLKVRVISTKNLLFDDKALMVSSNNIDGKFDILPGHANFISLVEKAPITIQKINGEVVKFDVPFAVIYHSQNMVNIYTDIPGSDQNK